MRSINSTTGCTNWTNHQVITAEGEEKASRALREASDTISESPAALQLRYLQVKCFKGFFIFIMFIHGEKVNGKCNSENLLNSRSSHRVPRLVGIYLYHRESLLGQAYWSSPYLPRKSSILAAPSVVEEAAVIQ